MIKYSAEIVQWRLVRSFDVPQIVIPVACGTTRERNAYVPPATSKKPLVGFTHALFSRSAITDFNPSVAVAANNNGATYPDVYVNSNVPPDNGSPLDAAYANNVAKIGVER